MIGSKNRYLMLLYLLSGCSPHLVTLNLPEGHPAHPAATIDKDFGRSTTLDVSSADPILPAHEMTTENHTEDSAAEKAASISQGALFECPMHPEITSTDPQNKCSKCGMKINKRVTDTKRADEPDSYQGIGGGG